MVDKGAGTGFSSGTRNEPVTASPTPPLAKNYAPNIVEILDSMPAIDAGETDQPGEI